MRLLMIGSGYVGLVSGACLAQMGHHVTCLDIDNEKIALLKNGEVPIYEPGLTEMLKRNLKQGRLSFTTDYKTAVKEASVCFIAVDTPSTSSGSASINSILSVASSIAEEMDSYKIVVNKSTVPVGTSELVRATMSKILKKRGVDHQFDVVSNPEFLKEGDAINDFMKPDRVVIGTDSEDAGAVMREIYAPFMHSRERLLLVDLPSSEMIKYASNAMLATRISFMNELSGLCEKTGADITKVRKGMGYDPRIGPSFLYAGLGFGGSCLPKDVRALRATAKEQDYQMPLIDAVYEANERQKKTLNRKIVDYYFKNNGISGKTFAILGLSFKPNTDDVRESAAIALIEQLCSAGAKVRLFDPVAMDNARKTLKDNDNCTWCDDETECCRGADALVLTTEWHQFRHLDLKTLFSKMKQPVLFDGRNQYDPEQMAKKECDYISIGRSPVMAFSSNNKAKLLSLKQEDTLCV